MRSGKDKKKLGEKLKNKYRIVVYTNDTFEEKTHFQLNRITVISTAVAIGLFLIAVTVYIVAFTPLRRYIPGYTDVTLDRRVYEIERRADSLERVFRQKDMYIENLRKIIGGYDFGYDSLNSKPIAINSDYSKITIKKSENDSLFRLNFEKEARRYLMLDDAKSQSVETESKPKKDTKFPKFTAPLNGYITSRFDKDRKHFGTDIVADTAAAIVAVYDGTVVFSDWNVETGYVIGIQHENDLLSFYKHNSELFKKEGDVVKSGDTIALIGGSGDLSTGPHLHFELWHDRTPLNPEEFMSFSYK